MNKRYQLFVSSTYEDLKDERAKVMETILNFDCFPAGMERFPAMDIKLFEYIKKIIDDSDYYLLIIGGRYGSVDKSSGKSWTEQEFDYAVSKGIPVMVFDHEDFTKLPANKTDQDDGKRKRLLEFKERVAKERLINKWSNADNLALKVSNSLRQVFDMQPRIGWVRANTVVISDSLEEIRSNKDVRHNKTTTTPKVATSKNEMAPIKVVSLKKKDHLVNEGESKKDNSKQASQKDNKQATVLVVCNHFSSYGLIEKIKFSMSVWGFDTRVLDLERSYNNYEFIEDLEKCLNYCNVVYVIAIFTAYEDGGELKLNDVVRLERRFSQNIFFVIGYFCTKLGDNRICALVADGVEFPKYLRYYIRINNNVDWKAKLVDAMWSQGLIDVQKY